MVLAMHQRNPDGQDRFGFFFEPDHWDGVPVNREPGKHSELIWADPAHLPADTVGYTRKAVTAIEKGLCFLVNGWDTAGLAAGRLRADPPSEGAPRHQRA
jgi:8-oxo-dGTP diphosphatase